MAKIGAALVAYLVSIVVFSNRLTALGFILMFKINDCSNRPIFAFGFADARPFINLARSEVYRTHCRLFKYWPGYL